MQRDTLLKELGLSPRWKLRAPVIFEGLKDIAPEKASAQGISVEATAEEPAVMTMPRPALSFFSDKGRSGEASISRDVSAPTEIASSNSCQSKSAASRPQAFTGDWDSLHDAIHNCRACPLGTQRQMAVPGIGDRQARWMFIGEAPGAEEDRLGEPFVGPAGQLLDAMLAAIGLNRQHDVYITNMVKCRPPANRNPDADEQRACRAFLERQIQLVQPRLIVLLGRVAAHALFERDASLASFRGRSHDYHGIPVVVTYHPSYLLRTPREKAKAWADLCLARRTHASLASSASR